MNDVSFEYFEFPKMVTAFREEFEKSAKKTSDLLVQRAGAIAKKMNADCDTSTYQKLKQERVFIQTIAGLIDQARRMYKFFEDAALKTQADWYASAIDGAALKDKIKFMQDTITEHYKQNQELLTLYRKSVNERSRKA